MSDSNDSIFSLIATRRKDANMNGDSLASQPAGQTALRLSRNSRWKGIKRQFLALSIMSSISFSGCAYHCNWLGSGMVLPHVIKGHVHICSLLRMSRVPKMTLFPPGFLNFGRHFTSFAPPAHHCFSPAHKKGPTHHILSSRIPLVPSLLTPFVRNVCNKITCCCILNLSESD